MQSLQVKISSPDHNACGSTTSSSFRRVLLLLWTSRIRVVFVVILVVVVGKEYPTNVTSHGIIGSRSSFIVFPVFGPFEELRLTGGELPALGIQGTFSRETRYLVRETTIDSGAVVSVVGDTTSEADPMARGEDYREAGKSTVFVAKDGKGPLAFAHGRATVLAQANKDLATLGLLRGVAFAFALAIPIVPILAVVLGR